MEMIHFLVFTYPTTGKWYVRSGENEYCFYNKIFIVTQEHTYMNIKSYTLHIPVEGCRLSIHKSAHTPRETSLVHCEKYFQEKFKCV